MKCNWSPMGPIVVLAALTHFHAWAAEPIDVQAAITKFAIAMEADDTRSLRAKLQGSELDTDKIQQIVSEAYMRYAKCVVNALINSDDPRLVTLLELLAAASTKSEIYDAWDLANPTDDTSFGDDVLPIFIPCAQTVDQELGLPADDDAT